MLLNYRDDGWFSTSNHHSTHSMIMQPQPTSSYSNIFSLNDDDKLQDERKTRSHVKDDFSSSSSQQTSCQWQEVAPSRDHNCDSFRPKISSPRIVGNWDIGKI